VPRPQSARRGPGDRAPTLSAILLREAPPGAVVPGGALVLTPPSDRLWGPVLAGPGRRPPDPAVFEAVGSSGEARNDRSRGHRSRRAGGRLGGTRGAAGEHGDEREHEKDASHRWRPPAFS